MKKLLFFVVAVSFAFAMNAQTAVFDKGSVMFNAGIGIPSNYGFIPSVNFSGEVGVIPTGDIGVVSFGGMAEFQFARYDLLWTDDENFVRFYVGPRAAWHFLGLNSDVFDVYAGAGFGVTLNGKSDTFGSSVDIDPDVFAGGRWMFSGNMGLFAEVGYTGLSFAKFGITFGM